MGCAGVVGRPTDTDAVSRARRGGGGGRRRGRGPARTRPPPPPPTRRASGATSPPNPRRQRRRLRSGGPRTSGRRSPPAVGTAPALRLRRQVADSVYLGTSAGTALRHDQPAARLEMNAKNDDCPPRPTRPSHGGTRPRRTSLRQTRTRTVTGLGQDRWTSPPAATDDPAPHRPRPTCLSRPAGQSAEPVRRRGPVRLARGPRSASRCPGAPSGCSATRPGRAAGRPVRHRGGHDGRYQCLRQRAAAGATDDRTKGSWPSLTFPRMRRPPEPTLARSDNLALDAAGNRRLDASSPEPIGPCCCRRPGTTGCSTRRPTCSPG